MKTIAFQLELPDHIFQELNQAEESLRSQFKLSIALMLFKDGKLTIGEAAQLAELPRPIFEEKLMMHQISVASIDTKQVFDDAEKINGL